MERSKCDVIGAKHFFEHSENIVVTFRGETEKIYLQSMRSISRVQQHLDRNNDGAGIASRSRLSDKVLRKFARSA